jgi:predicted O-linked N-acetylglucosamine transferase (SPINDLY family)
VPVISITGSAHSERTGASILNAIGLPDLAADNIEDYETLARDLARDPEALGALRKKLAGNLETAPLFDVNRLARHVEAAYRLMWENHAAGRAPQTINVPGAD